MAVPEATVDSDMVTRCAWRVYEIIEVNRAGIAVSRATGGIQGWNYNRETHFP